MTLTMKKSTTVTTAAAIADYIDELNADKLIADMEAEAAFEAFLAEEMALADAMDAALAAALADMAADYDAEYEAYMADVAARDAEEAAWRQDMADLDAAYQAGVETGDFSFYSDVYKDIYGVRPRW